MCTFFGIGLHIVSKLMMYKPTQFALLFSCWSVSSFSSFGCWYLPRKEMVILKTCLFRNEVWIIPLLSVTLDNISLWQKLIHAISSFNHRYLTGMRKNNCFDFTNVVRMYDMSCEKILRKFNTIYKKTGNITSKVNEMFNC